VTIFERPALLGEKFQATAQHLIEMPAGELASALREIERFTLDAALEVLGILGELE
jgi:hypothetical protein